MYLKFDCIVDFRQLVWFLAPTVALCVQQHVYLRSYLPAVRTQLLTGADNVDRWSEHRIWDSVLEGVRIVVSTHAVLADALSHGFIAMRRLALIVFDEGNRTFQCTNIINSLSSLMRSGTPCKCNHEEFLSSDQGEIGRCSAYPWPLC